ncbi:MAG: hypothetical protein AB8B61_06085 [Cyclobacteriaceae bacterium]
MEIKYTKNFLNKLEDIFSESEYILRYEKGNFNSGYCILKETQVVIINKYYTLEGKINCLLEILTQLNIDSENLSAKNADMLEKIVASKNE